MPKQAVFILSLLFALIVSFQCKKPKADPNSDNGLPPATQEGKNVFACKVNGQPWISQRGLRNMGATILDDTLGVHGSLEKGDNSIEDIWINLFSVFNVNVKSYHLNDTLRAYSVYQVVGSNRCINNNTGFGGGGRKKGTDGMITFTKIDTLNKIVSGTFNFVVPTDYCDTLKVTDGRFDYHF